LARTRARRVIRAPAAVLVPLATGEVAARDGAGEVEPVLDTDVPRVELPYLVRDREPAVVGAEGDLPVVRIRRALCAKGADALAPCDVPEHDRTPGGLGEGAIVVAERDGGIVGPWRSMEVVAQPAPVARTPERDMAADVDGEESAVVAECDAA